MTTPPNKPGAMRRWRSFSLRALLLFMLLLAIGLAGLKWRMNRAAVQEKAVAELLTLGCSVRYDHQWSPDSSTAIAQRKSPVSPYLRRLLSNNFFHDVVYVYGGRPRRPNVQASDEESRCEDLRFWRSLADLPRVKELIVVDRTIVLPQDRTVPCLATLETLSIADLNDDAECGKELFSRLTRLRELSIAQPGPADPLLAAVAKIGKLERVSVSAPISDACLTSLRECRRLRTLHLYDARQVTGESLQAISQCGELEELLLVGGQISDDDMRHLASLKQLRMLDISLVAISDNGLRELKDLANVESLSLRYTQVEGSDLPRFTSAGRLEQLDLQGSHAGDALLRQLDRFPALEHLSLDATKVTTAGVLSTHWPSSLIYLSLEGTTIDASALESVQNCSKLKWLNLGKGVATQAEVAGVQRALPKCKILLTESTPRDASSFAQ